MKAEDERLKQKLADAEKRAARDRMRTIRMGVARGNRTEMHQ